MWTYFQGAKPSSVRYTLGPIIGQGSSGVVFQALRKDVNGNYSQQIAIKVLKSRNLVNLWRKEFETLSLLASPHFIKIYGFEWLEGQPSLVLEYIEGLTLTEVWAYCHLQPKDISFIMNQLAQGLADLHRQNHSHGDLSPNNIMIDLNGKIKLLDFGVRLHDLKNRHATLAYAAPELFNAEKIDGPAADWFAMGKIFAQAAQKLHCENLFKDIILNLTQPNPVKRQWNSIALDGYDSKTLQIKIKEGLEKKQALTTKTQILDLSLKNRGNAPFRLNPRYLFPFLFFSLGFYPSTAHQQGEIYSAKQVAKISFRSHHWMQFFLDQKYIGYAPITLDKVPAGQHELKWKSEQNHGSLTLTLLPGQHMILNEKKIMQLKFTNQK